MAPDAAWVTLSLTWPLLSAALFPGQGLSLSPSLLLLSSRAVDVGKSWAVQAHVCSKHTLDYIYTSFLDSAYMCSHMIFVFLFLIHFTLYCSL